MLVDTSGLIAALFADQNQHEACAQVLVEAEPPLILSPFVLAEADYLIRKYGGFRAELAFLEEVGRGVYDIATISPRDVYEARELKLSLADASIVVLAERHDCRDVLTLDRRFETCTFAGRKKFRLRPG